MKYLNILELIKEESENNIMLIYKIVEKAKFEEVMDKLDELTIGDVVACLEDRECWSESLTELFRSIIISEKVGNRTGSILIVLKELPNNEGYEFHRVVDLNNQRAIFDLYLMASQYDQEFVNTDHFKYAIEYFTSINAEEIVSALKALRGTYLLNERKKELLKYQN